MLMRSVFFTVLALFFSITTVEAYTCTGDNCVVILQYTEPTTYTSGTPLTNLQDGVFTFQLDGGVNQVVTVPASKPQGGGAISIPLAAQLVPVCTSKTITGSLVMRTSAGGVSVPSIATPRVVDRTKLASGVADPSCVTPNPGSNVIIQ